ncbi:MAG: hypothetical protein Q8O37_09340 [Sulfuricellaceae bacterium]|nr:hypothetical protein [Sulfuricellaceae bacterium]
MQQSSSEVLPTHETSTSQQNHELVDLAFKRGGSVRLRNSLSAAQGTGVLDSLTIQSIVSNDAHAINKLMRIPNFGAKCLAELKEISLLESNLCRNATFQEKNKKADSFHPQTQPNHLERISIFVNTDSAPNLPCKLSNIQINIIFLDELEKKFLKKIEKMFGQINLQSFLAIDEKILLAAGGFGAKYLSIFRSLHSTITQELLSIVDARKEIDFKIKSILVMTGFFHVDLREIDQMLLDDVEEYLFSLDDESRQIIMSRWGFHCKPETLDQLGVRYRVERERIRQKEKVINTDLLRTLRIHPDVLKKNIKNDSTINFYTLFNSLSSCFDNEKCFYNFLDILCQTEKGEIFRLVHPEVRANFLDAYFCENTSPVNKEVLIEELISNYGYARDQAINVLIVLQNKFRLKITSDIVSPINLGKIEAVAHILLSHPNGLPWKDIAKIINRKGCCSSNMNENRLSSNYLGDSDYVYLCGRGTYRHINYLDMSKIDITLIMDNIREYFYSTNTDSIHLNNFYHQAKQDIKVIDYFDLRHIVRSFCSEYGFYFNGQSGVDGLGIAENFTRVTQQKLILDIMNKARGAITKVEVAERLRSKSIGHANFYLDRMMEEGQVVRIDKMMYTTPEKAFSCIDTESILHLMNDIISGTRKIIESDVFRFRINSALNVGYTKYFYAALASINLDKYGWTRIHNLFSRYDIPYKSLNDAFSTLCDPILTNAENIEKIKLEIELTDQVAANGIRYWRLSAQNDLEND